MPAGRFRYAVVFLMAAAYVLIGLTFAYGDTQLREGQRLQCAIAQTQIMVLHATLAQTGQSPQLQVARRDALYAWRQLARSYACS